MNHFFGKMNFLFALVFTLSAMTTGCGKSRPSLAALSQTKASTPVAPTPVPNPMPSPTPSEPDPIATLPPEDQSEKPLALIYKGPGSCSTEDGDAGDAGYGCSEASADAAMEAGFRYKFVGPRDMPNFSEAKVWIQPGGVSNNAYYAMTPKLRAALIKFVDDGGGYVGYCAGAFLATDWFYLIPANSGFYNYTPARYDVGYALLDLKWNGHKRVVFFEGGPYFYNVKSNVQVTATFSGGYAAAIRSTYGKGRVYISGPHPEAPKIWNEEDGIIDPDGSDLDLAAEMITWAAGPSAHSLF